MKNSILLLVAALFSACVVTDDLPPEDINRPESGLRLYITFDNQTAEDVSGFGHNGVLNGDFITNTPNGEGYAYDIVTSNDKLVVPYNPFYGITEYSFCFWVKDPSQGLLMNTYGDSDDNTARNFPTIRISNNLLYSGFSWSSTSDYFDYNPSVILQDGGWHHIAVSVRDGYQRLYVNGVLVSTQQEDVDENESSQVHFGGSLGSIAGTYMKIDNIRLYSRAISEVEVVQIMNQEL